MVAGNMIGAGIESFGTTMAGIVGRAKTPKYVTPPEFNATKTTAEAINAANANYAAANTFTKQANTDAQAQANALMEQAMPGFGALQKRLLSQVESDLNSQTSLPKEVQDQIAQFAAEKGVTRGTSGGFNNFSLVKDFGFNLVDWQNAKRASALNTLSSVYGMTPRVNPMSPMSMLLSTGQVADYRWQSQNLKYNAEQAYANTVANVRNYNASLHAATHAKLGAIWGNAFSMNGASPGGASNGPGAMSMFGGGK